MKTKMKITSNDSLLISVWFSSTVLEEKDFISVDMFYNGFTKNGPRKKSPGKLPPGKLSPRKRSPMKFFCEFFLTSSFYFYDNFRP